MQLNTISIFIDISFFIEEEDEIERQQQHHQNLDKLKERWKEEREIAVNLEKILQKQTDLLRQQMYGVKDEIIIWFKDLEKYIHDMEIEMLENLEKEYTILDSTLSESFFKINQVERIEYDEITEDSKAYVKTTLDEFDEHLPKLIEIASIRYTLTTNLSGNTSGSDKSKKTDINTVKEMLKSLGTISVEEKYLPPKSINIVGVSSFVALLEWDKRYKNENYEINIYDINNMGTPIIVDTTQESHYFASPLKMNKEYFARVKIKSTDESKIKSSEWIESKNFETNSRDVFADITNYQNDPKLCMDGFDTAKELVVNGTLDNMIGEHLILFIMRVTEKHLAKKVVDEAGKAREIKTCLSSLGLLDEVLKKYASGVKNSSASPAVRELIKNLKKSKIFPLL